MNKIFNWTFGSVFRTFGRILAYLLFGVLIGVLMHKNNIKIIDLLGIEKVSASEITSTTPKGYTFQYDSCTNYYCNGSNDPILNTTGLKDFGTSTSINTSNYNYVFRNGVVNSYSFNSNNTYTFNYRIHLGGNSSGINTINTFQLYNNWKFTVLGYKNANDGYLDDYINSSSCSVRFDNSTNNGYLVSCNVALNVNVSRINIQTIFYNNVLIQGGEYLNYDFSSVRVNLISILENEGQGALIDKQTNQLIDNQNKNTENIINNQNENTQNIINSSLVCKKVDITSANLNGYLNASGDFVEQPGNYNKSTDFIELNGSIIKLISPSNNNKRVCFYKTNKDFISCKEMNQYSSGDIISVPANAFYYRLNFEVADRLPVFNICSNGNQTTNDSINELKDSIMDDSSPGISGLSNSTTAGWLPPGPLDSILNLPLTFLNSLITGMSGSCAPLRVPLPYVNMELPIPCMSTIYNDMGFGTFFNWVGNIAAAFILFSYLIRLYKYVDDTLTFRENNFIDNWSGV